MTQVYTTHGLVDRDRLTMQVISVETESAVEIACEWRLGDELVRRDAWINFLRGQAVNGEQGGF
jgi:hypothetical protein